MISKGKARLVAKGFLQKQGLYGVKQAPRA